MRVAGESGGSGRSAGLQVSALGSWVGEKVGKGRGPRLGVGVEQKAFSSWAVRLWTFPQKRAVGRRLHG